jgi:hypothetical protein
MTAKTRKPPPLELQAGAVDIGDCQRKNKRRPCRCEPCTRCGYGKHTAVHGPKDGKAPGTEPWDHAWKSAHAPGDDASSRGAS